MKSTSVTSKGQVTIPKPLRQKLGIRKGSKIAFRLAGDHIEMTVQRSPAPTGDTGFGMLKSRKLAVPADFDPASLMKGRRDG